MVVRPEATKDQGFPSPNPSTARACNTNLLVWPRPAASPLHKIWPKLSAQQVFRGKTEYGEFSAARKLANIRIGEKITVCWHMSTMTEYCYDMTCGFTPSPQDQIRICWSCGTSALEHSSSILCQLYLNPIRIHAVSPHSPQLWYLCCCIYIQLLYIYSCFTHMQDDSPLSLDKGMIWIFAPCFNIKNLGGWAFACIYPRCCKARVGFNGSTIIWNSKMQI